jgi:hypothetical protein
MTLQTATAQTTMHSYYDLSATYNASAYNELSSPTVLTESGGDDFTLTNGGSNGIGPGYQIGFNFYFNGEYFTRFGISSNGFIGLGTEADGVNVISSLTNYMISYPGTISPSRLRSRIVAFGYDIVHKGSGYSPAISYSTLGSTPNRILVVQFKGWRRYDGHSESDDLINYQIRLHETLNKIEIIYGSSNATTASTQVEVGLGGKSTDEYFNLTTTSNWASPSYGQSVDAKMTFSQTVHPSSGTIYTWTLRTMSYSSATTEQASTNFVLKGQTNQQIIRLKITTTGWVFPFSVTSISFTTTGTTTVGNLIAARVYYTNSDNFFTATQFASQISSPNGTLTFNGSQELGSSGVHSFWLVYDIKSDATTNSQYVDGTCTSFTTNESGNPTRNPTVTDPTGDRQILGGLSGTVTVGDGGDYPTLSGSSISTGLFYAINSLGLTGNLTVNIISDITETGFTVLNQWTESGGSGYTVTIQPSEAVLKTISGSGSSFLIKFNGADRVTINGNYSSSGQYLKFQNTNTSSSASALYLGNSSTNNSIKNCLIEGSASSDGVISLTSTSSNNLFENCVVQNYSNNPMYGISFNGNPNNSNTIKNCSISNFSSRGIYAWGEGITIENCEVFLSSAITGSPIGISLYVPTGTTLSNTIKNNKVHDLSSSSSSSEIKGIAVSCYSGSTNVYNNTVTLNSSSNNYFWGLDLRYYGATLNTYYNSIYVSGSVAGYNSYAIYCYNQGAASTLRIKNNSAYNARTNSSGSAKHFAIYFVNITNTTFDLNYNDYFISGTGGILGYWNGVDRTSLSDWKSASSQDNNSIGSDPKYVSTSNLKPFNTSPLISAGTTIDGITTDIDGTARHASTPYIGAYESSQVPVTVDFCNLETGNTTIKEGQTSTFSARVEKSGVTTGEGRGVGIQCWIGYSNSNTNPSTWSTWTVATYIGDVGDRDEYTVTFPSSLTPGTYYVASRFFITNASDYQYGGSSGEWNDNSSILTIQDNVINFANAVNSPVSVKLGVNKKFYARYGLPDITTQSTESPAVQTWIGYNTTNTDPSGWENWVAATYVGQSGNYHEYEANFGSTFNVGTYYYASRFKLNDDSYVYGGYSSDGGGIYNGSTNVNGTINVNAELPLFENFDNVTAPALPNDWSKTATTPAWSTSTSNYNSSPNSVLGISYSNVTADSWLFSPQLNLTGGTTYTVVFYSWYSNLFSGGKLKGRYGTTATAGGMTSSNVFDITTTTTKTRYSYTFTPSSSGTYYFGWHNYSTYYTSYPGPLCIDDVQIYEAPANTSAQTIPLNNTTQYTFGSTDVTIKFDVANGQNLTINVDQVNSSPGVNGSLPSGVNQTISQYWNIALTSGSITTGVYSISIDVTGIAGVNNPKDLYLLKRTNSNSEWQNLGKPTYTEGNVCTWSGLTSFSEFTLGGDSENPLPVELNSFNASVVSRNVFLQWQTTTEVDSYGFEIERCEKSNVKGETWQKVGFVQGNGNSNSVKSYSFTDEKLNSGKYSYRLKMINTDGSFEHSPVVEVEIGTPKEFTLSQNYPNPFNPTTKIDYQLPFNSEVKIELYSITGERAATLVHQQQEAGYYTIEVNTSKISLASGVYVYRITVINETDLKTFINSKKFIVLK